MGFPKCAAAITIRARLLSPMAPFIVGAIFISRVSIAVWPHPSLRERRTSKRLLVACAMRASFQTVVTSPVWRLRTLVPYGKNTRVFAVAQPLSMFPSQEASEVEHIAAGKKHSCYSSTDPETIAGATLTAVSFTIFIGHYCRQCAASTLKIANSRSHHAR